jgi:heptosyltransferase-2
MRCLVVQTAFLGDVALTVPLLGLLRRDPGVTWIGVLAAPPGPELLEGQNVADEIISYDKRCSQKGVRSMSGVVARLRELEIEAALVPHRSFRSALMTWLARIPRRVGFDESGGRFLLTRVVPYRTRPHEVERVASLAEAIGIPLPEGRLPFELRPPDGAEASLLSDLAGRGIDPETPVIAVAPGSRWPTKRWPEGRFAAAADALTDGFGAKAVLIGSSDDRAVCARVSSLMESDAADLSGALSLPRTIALTGRAMLVLSNDSAAAHIAAGSGAPVVVVFGPTVPAQGFAPYSDRSRVVEADVACRPCGRHGGLSCRRGDLACMHSVRVEDVLRAAEELVPLDGGRP